MKLGIRRGLYHDVQLFDCSIRTKLNKHSKQKQPSKNETKSMIVISSWKVWKRTDEKENRRNPYVCKCEKERRLEKEKGRGKEGRKHTVKTLNYGYDVIHHIHD